MHAKVGPPKKYSLMPDARKKLFHHVNTAYTLLIVHEFVIIEWGLNNQIRKV